MVLNVVRALALAASCCVVTCSGSKTSLYVETYSQHWILARVGLLVCCYNCCVLRIFASISHPHNKTNPHEHTHARAHTHTPVHIYTYTHIHTHIHRTAPQCTATWKFSGAKKVCQCVCVWYSEVCIASSTHVVSHVCFWIWAAGEPIHDGYSSLLNQVQDTACGMSEWNRVL